MSDLFPPGVILVESDILVNPDQLLPKERSIVQLASSKRKREFATGRILAHRAMSVLLGTEHQYPILRGNGGEPLWPDEVVGSITHCDGYCAAAVALKHQFLSLAIDAEPLAPLEDEVLNRICDDVEIQMIDRLESKGKKFWRAIIFSGKECIFKSQYPTRRNFVDFQDIRISISPETNTFLGYEKDICGNPTSKPAFRGRYCTDGGFVRTAIANRMPSVF